MTKLSVSAVMEERSGLEAKMQALQQIADEEKRALSKEELATMDGLLADFESTDDSLARAKRYEKTTASILQERKHAVAEQVRTEQTQSPVTHAGTSAGPKPPVIRHIGMMRESQLVAFKSTEEAYCAGMWFKAVFDGDQQARQFCEQYSSSVPGGLGFRPGNMTSAPATMFDERGAVVMEGQEKTDPTKGGVFVPVIVSDAILDVRDRVGACNRLARRWPLTGSDDHDVPKDDSNLTVYGKAELANIPTSENVFSSVSLRAKDKYTLTPISNTLLRNKPDFAGDITAQRIAYAFAWQIDEEWINGDGQAGAPHYDILGLIPGLTGTGTAGLITATGATLGDLTTITGDHLRSLKLALADKFYTENTAWLTSRAVFNATFEPLIEARGGSKSDMEGATGLMYQGFPIVLSERMPTAGGANEVPIMFGDFNQSSIYGDRENVQVDSSPHIYFHQDATAVRGAIAYDIKVHRTGDGSTAGGYVGLQMPAA